jgi:hypothetical protein
VTYTLLHEGDPSIESIHDYLRVDAAATRQVRGGRSGLRFIVAGAQPKAAYDGRESL